MAIVNKTESNNNIFGWVQLNYGSSKGTKKEITMSNYPAEFSIMYIVCKFPHTPDIFIHLGFACTLDIFKGLTTWLTYTVVPENSVYF